MITLIEGMKWICGEDPGLGGSRLVGGRARACFVTSKVGGPKLHQDYRIDALAGRQQRRLSVLLDERVTAMVVVDVDKPGRREGRSPECLVATAQ